VLPVVPTARDFSYLRQVTRTNNAAVVAPGALKPTSSYKLMRIEGRLRVIAHLSEPIDKYWLSDNAALGQFAADELFYGLKLALEDEIVNGTGTGEHLTGFNATSGVQTQAYVDDPICTARAAVTKVETVFGDSAGYWLFNPVDWELIETQTTSSGANILGDAGAAVPIDRAARRLWGLPVALTLAQAPGAGWFVGSDAATLYSDTGGVQVEWFTPGDDFQRNQLRARCKGRFDLAVTRPLGLVKLDLTAYQRRVASTSRLPTS
jgi:HK97 family phage major capsid protein